jgi:CelD/BcsL family acetyltransferase involved in cellulose biosynthesis
VTAIRARLAREIHVTLASLRAKFKGPSGDIPLAQANPKESTGSWTDAVRREHFAALRTVPIRTETLSADVITDIEGIRALTPDYVHLYQVTGNALPFATQEWHLAWCEHLLSRVPHISQRLLFCVLRSGDGRCVAIVPLIMTRRRLGPLKVAALGLVGADPALTEIHNPLIAPGYERATVRTVHERLAALPGWDWIEWSRVSAAFAEALRLEAAPQWYQTLDDYVLDLPPSWTEFRASLPRNLRESLRHCYNSLRRDEHTFDFIVAREPLEVRSALSRFLELHTQRAQMPRGPKHADHFAARSLRAFLYGVCERLAARDAVRVFQLRIAGSVVASRLGFVVGDSLYLYYSGFDPAWARYSVMTTTMSEALRYAIANGLKSVNLSLTSDRAKLRWRPRRVDFHSALVHRDSVRSRLACGAFRLAVSGRGTPLRLLQRLLRARRDWN